MRPHLRALLSSIGLGGVRAPRTIDPADTITPNAPRALPLTIEKERVRDDLTALSRSIDTRIQYAQRFWPTGVWFNPRRQRRNAMRAELGLTVRQYRRYRRALNRMFA